MTARRVLQVLGQSEGGVGRHVAEITRALDDGERLVIDVAAPPDLRVPMPKPLVPVRIPHRTLRGHFSVVRTLAQLLRSGSYDLLHAHGLRAAMDGVIAARRANVPAAVTLHNVIMPEVSGGLAARTLAWMEPYVVRASVKTFVPSAEMERYLRARAHAPNGRIEVLHAGAGEPPEPRRSREAVRAELGITTADPLVVSVARLQPQKALDVMLEAIAMLPANVMLALVGDGRLRADLQTAARELGIADRVRFLGFRHDVADYIAAGDVFCLSSLWEAVPLAAQEAVLLGVPIVSTDVGGLSELIVDGVSGRLVPKNDSRSLAKALEETLSEHDLRRRFADEARRHYDEHFSRAAVLGRLERLYLDAARTS